MSNYLAIDLGAESGRVILGQLKAGKFTMKEVHRFSNGAIKIGRASCRERVLRLV